MSGYFGACSSESILGLADSTSESMSPESVILEDCPRFVRGPPLKRYWTAGRKGLGLSVFLAENIWSRSLSRMQHSITDGK